MNPEEAKEAILPFILTQPLKLLSERNFSNEAVPIQLMKWLNFAEQKLEDPKQILQKDSTNLILLKIFQSLSLIQALHIGCKIDKEKAKELLVEITKSYLPLPKLGKYNITETQNLYSVIKKFKVNEEIANENEGKIDLPIRLVSTEPKLGIDPKNEKLAIELNLNLIKLSIKSMGRIDYFFNTYVYIQTIITLAKLAGEDFEEFQKKSSEIEKSVKNSIDLIKVYEALPQQVMTKEKYKKLLNDFSDKSNQEKYIEYINIVYNSLFHSQISQDEISLHYIEKLLILLLGQWNKNVIDNSIVLLNVFYDGIDFQFKQPFNPIVSFINQDFIIDTTIYCKEDPILIYIAIVNPFQCPEPKKQSIQQLLIDINPIEGKANYYSIHLNLFKFMKSGYYDWRIMIVDKNRNTSPAILQVNEKEFKKAIGRCIVYPNDVFDLQPHELYVDYTEKKNEWPRIFDQNKDEVIRLASQGVNCVYLMGALERDNIIEYPGIGGSVNRQIIHSETSPLSITDRALANKLLGGATKLKELIDIAHSSNVKILLDSVSRVSSSHANRKYKKLTINSIDDDGKIIPFYGTDGRAIKYEDTAMLNYRKLKSWNLLIEEILTLANNYNIDGIHLDNGQSWPQIFELDESELKRLDTDGKPCYSPKEILEGIIVKSNEISGFWNSANSNIYANPFFVKMSMELWRHFPNFLIIGECWGGYLFENRHNVLTRSGIIPRVFNYPIQFSAIFGKQLSKDGQISSCNPKSVLSIHEIYEKFREKFPENAPIIQSSTSHIWPYPAYLYGPGVWPAIDAMFFMPDIPMTFLEEQEGKIFRPETTLYFFGKKPEEEISGRGSNFLQRKTERVQSSTLLFGKDTQASKKDEPEALKKIQDPQSGFDIRQINKHYTHRRGLRRTKRILQYGKYLPLYARRNEVILDNILAFCRFSKSEIAIVVISFSNEMNTVNIDLSPIIKENTFNLKKAPIIQMTNWIESSKPEEFFFDEILNEKLTVTLFPYQSHCIGISLIHEPSLELIGQTLYKSLIRMRSDILKDRDISRFHTVNELLTMVNEKCSVNDFMRKLTLIHKYYLEPYKFTLRDFLSHILIIKDFSEKSTVFYSYLYKILNSDVQGIECAKLVLYKSIESFFNSEKLGPIVFISPEIRPYSTVGGVAVIVADLAIQLAKLGEDVIVISPYYNLNNKGITGYLPSDKFQYKKNISINLGSNELVEVGVHEGKDSGFKYVFLHNAKYFPLAYPPKFDAENTIKSMTLIAKGSLEYLCQSSVLPSIIITNDWFTGLTPSYKKNGCFGTTFYGVTFLHIIHNLDPLYEGRVYNEPSKGFFEHIHGISYEYLKDPFGDQRIINPSRCAIVASDQIATVSKGYLNEILNASPLNPLLKRHKRPFAHSNGTDVIGRRKELKEKFNFDHLSAKKELQKKYFGYEDLDDSVPIYSFIGRITKQKGVHLIREVAEQLIHETGFKINILIGGPVSKDEPAPYGMSLFNALTELNRKYPKCFFADPGNFFFDGLKTNLGSDFAVMPSEFEPGGIVQHEYFAAGTPVIANRTGGLMDSVFEYQWNTRKGNGFLMENYSKGGLLWAIQRSLGTFKSKEHYMALRKNAYDSPMDARTMALEWDKEFRRLRGKVNVDIPSIIKGSDLLDKWDVEKVNDLTVSEEEANLGKKIDTILYPVLFRLKQKGYNYSSVFLSGSFDNWVTKMRMNFDSISQEWYVNLPLKRGKYVYKYYLDNNWNINEEEPIEVDANGFKNNVITV